MSFNTASGKRRCNIALGTKEHLHTLVSIPQAVSAVATRNTEILVSSAILFQYRKR